MYTVYTRQETVDIIIRSLPFLINPSTPHPTNLLLLILPLINPFLPLSPPSLLNPFSFFQRRKTKGQGGGQ